MLNGHQLYCCIQISIMSFLSASLSQILFQSRGILSCAKGEEHCSQHSLKMLEIFNANQCPSPSFNFHLLARRMSCTGLKSVPQAQPKHIFRGLSRVLQCAGSCSGPVCREPCVYLPCSTGWQSPASFKPSQLKENKPSSAPSDHGTLQSLFSSVV